MGYHYSISNKSNKRVTVMVVDFFAVEISGVAVPDGGIRIRGSWARRGQFAGTWQEPSSRGPVVSTRG